MLPLALIACLAGIAGVYIRLRREFPRGTTLTALVLLAGATPLFWNTLFEPSPVAVAAFAVTAWLAVAVQSRRLRTRASSPSLLILWVALCAVPLAIVWRTALAGAPFDPLTSRWPGVLFSSWGGFLSLTPVVYIAVVGTVFYLRRDRAWSVVALALLLVCAWAVGAGAAWLGDPAVVGRSLIALLVVLAPGLAYVIEAVRHRPVLAMAPLIALPIVWNHLLMVQYTVGLLPKDEPVSFARLVQQQADLHARTTPLYPFAFPANAWFAWRERLPIDRYEVLVHEPRSAAPDLILDRNAGRFLLEGWDGPTAEGENPGWWIGASPATIAIPLATPSASAFRLTIAARSRFEEPVVEADLAVLVNGHDVGQFSPSSSQPSEAQLTVPATLLREGFNEISFVSRGTHRVDPSDTRPPGPLASRSARRAWPVAVYRIALAPI